MTCIVPWLYWLGHFLSTSLFRLLGTPAQDKTQRIFDDAGHFPSADDIPEASAVHAPPIARPEAPIPSRKN